MDRIPPEVAGEPANFVDADAELKDTLHSLEHAQNYTSWITGLLAPHLGQDILEVGAGHGTITSRLAAYGRVTATEMSPRSAELLQQRFAAVPNVDVHRADLVPPDDTQSYDSIVLINVLEHIEDDRGALEALGRRLKPGGRILLFVPALPVLYSQFDQRIGHWRRYRRADLRAVVERAGLQTPECFYVNAPGALGWWLFAKKLRRVPTTRGSVMFFDRLVPIFRWAERRHAPPFGQSLFCVATNAVPS